MSIISYVDDRHKSRAWHFGPPIAVIITTKEYLAQPQADDVLIIHGGQDDGGAKCVTGKTRLNEAVLRICRRGGRAIVFSGGHSTNSALLRADLSNEKFEENVHYMLLSAILNLEQEIDMPLLMKTTIAPGWPIHEVKRRHAAPTLLTLGLLCQAALLSFDPKAVNHDAAELLGGEETMAAVRADWGIASADRLLTPGVWRLAFERADAGALLESIQREWPGGDPMPNGVRQLINTLYGDAQALQPALLSRAFTELQGALDRNQSLQQ